MHQKEIHLMISRADGEVEYTITIEIKRACESAIILGRLSTSLS